MDQHDLENRMMALIQSQAGFLAGRQVSCPTLTLESGESARIAPFDGVTLNIAARHGEEGWSLSSGTGWEAVTPGVPFRLALSAPEDVTKVSAVPPASGLKAKIRRYAAYPDLYRRLPIFVIDTLSRRRRARACPDRPAPDKQLRTQGGLTFTAHVDGEGLRLECLDDGGIFDMNLNTEGDSFPWQVPVGYYSTEYAAFVFAWLWHRTGIERWRLAANRAVAFSLRNLAPYTVLSFDH